MTFLNPLVLFGLVAAGVPILIHLLQLKKLRMIEFSSIKFLKEIQHASAKRVKLRDYLLLILRSLALASFVLAFARPTLRGINNGNSKTSSVVIIDDSPSGTARNEYGEIFSQLRNTASSLINSFNIGDNANLIFTSRLKEGGYVDSSEILSSINPQSLLQFVARAEPSNVRVSYNSAIKAAIQRLESSNYIYKDIYLFGDLQRTEFETQNENENISNFSEATLMDDRNLRLFFLQTTEASNDNLSISNVKLSNPVEEINTPSEVQATIVNNGTTEKDGVVVSLYLDDRKVAQSVTDLPGGNSRNVSLSFSVKDGGFHRGKVEIDDNSIQLDNNFYFSFFAIKRLNVIIVNSKNDIDFVYSAVNAVIDTSTSVDVKVLTPDQLSYADLSKIDVVVVETYSPSQSLEGKLNQFVRNGGGVILFGPSSSQLNFFNGLVSIMNIGRASAYFSSNGGNFLSIDKIDAADEFFLGLFSSKESADQIKDQLATKISNMARIDASPFAHILIGSSYGPFLISREVGNGFAFVFSSAADSSSSNFQMSPFFPVVVQHALFYSASVKHKPIQIYAGGGSTFTYSPGGIKSAILVAPDGGRAEVIPIYVGGAARFTFRNLDELGTYSLTNGTTFGSISVNIDPRESNLSKASPTDVINFAKHLGFDRKNIFLLDADKKTTSNIEKLRHGQDLSSFFACATLLFLVLEIFASKMRTF